MTTRCIVHFRFKSFFAGIEQLRLPELDGRPVVVAKSVGSGSIVVSTSPEAEECGVREGMTVRHAQRLCPDAAFLPASYPYYTQLFEQILDILTQYSPLLEPHSLDRAFLDITKSRNVFGSPVKIVKDAVERTASVLEIKPAVGISANKLAADAASVAALPGEIKLVSPREISEFLHPLLVRQLPRVGAKTERRLADLGVHTVGQLARIPEVLLIRQFGPLGKSLHRLSQGIDHSPVEAAYPPKIIKIEHTFEEELEEPAEVESRLRIAADDAAMMLRGRGELAGAVTLKLTIDHGLYTMNPPVGTYRFKKPVSSAGETLHGAVRLLRELMRPGMTVSGLELTLSDLAPGEGLQLCLLGEGERRRRLDLAVESVKDRFGDSSIFHAGVLAADGRARVLKRLSA